MQTIRRIHLVLAWAFVAGVVYQVFLAGRGVFENPALFKTHAGWGYTIGLLPLLLLATAALSRQRRQVFYAAALFGMFILQSILVALRTDMPTVAALHPVNGFGILLVAFLSAREAWATRNAAPDAAAEPTAEPATDAAR
jgi:MYXO-CTERM domain-containing protein